MPPRALEKTEGRDIPLWTKAEDDRVADFDSQGITIPVQATLLGRSEGAVKARRRYLDLSKPSVAVSVGIQKANQARNHPATCEKCKSTYLSNEKSWQKKICPFCKKKLRDAASAGDDTSGFPLA